MANLKALRIRIRSVKNTTQLTRTMSMIAASKMRRAQSKAIAAQTYVQGVKATLERLINTQDKKIVHPLLSGNQSKKIAVLIITTDRGLCGALNTNLFRRLQEADFFARSVFFATGRKGLGFIRKNKLELIEGFEYKEDISLEQGRYIAERLKVTFLNREAGKIYLAYPRFITTLRQEPTLELLLPITTSAETKFKSPPITEPTKERVVDFIVNHYIESKLIHSLSEARASEHSSRMVAMQNATDNAKKLSDELTLQLNKMRQETITRELLDIASTGEEAD